MIEGDDRRAHGGGHLVHFEHGQSLGQLGGHRRLLGVAGLGRRRAGARVVALGRRAGVTAGMTRNSLVPFVRHSLLR